MFARASKWFIECMCVFSVRLKYKLFDSFLFNLEFDCINSWEKKSTKNFFHLSRSPFCNGSSGQTKIFSNVLVENFSFSIDTQHLYKQLWLLYLVSMVSKTNQARKNMSRKIDKNIKKNNEWLTSDGFEGANIIILFLFVSFCFVLYRVFFVWSAWFHSSRHNFDAF